MGAEMVWRSGRAGRARRASLVRRVMLASLVLLMVLPALLGTSGCSSAASGGGGVVFGPEAQASRAFWQHWGDGKAELSGYAITTSRYGKPRQGHVVLIYVTEPLDRRTWIKDEGTPAPAQFRVEVLKLNHMLKFRTGIYPYSVMTSVFSPVDGMLGRRRFAPVKITFTSQEWCGHVFQQLAPRAAGFTEELRSYFEREGDRRRFVNAPSETLYEDALLIQLRQLDGRFGAAAASDGARVWTGYLVPSLWSGRKVHEPLAPLPAVIKRYAMLRDGQHIARFVVAYGSVRRTFDVERDHPRRILSWHDTRGEPARLLATARLAYWQLNDPGDQSYLEQLGLQPTTAATPEPATPR